MTDRQNLRGAVMMDRQYLRGTVMTDRRYLRGPPLMARHGGPPKVLMTTRHDDPLRC